MASGMISPISIVIDANVVIALCAKEADKVANAEAKMKEYIEKGCSFYAPGVIIAECLYVLCRKVSEGVLTPFEHNIAVNNLIKILAEINPPPMGDNQLVKRAEEIRGNLGCSRSADGIYLALAVELNATETTEIVTFDTGLPNQAAISSLQIPICVIPISSP